MNARALMVGGKGLREPQSDGPITRSPPDLPFPMSAAWQRAPFSPPPLEHGRRWKDPEEYSQRFMAREEIDYARHWP